MKITFSTRTGKDYFDYMRLAQISKDRADEWAIEKFVLLDGRKLTIEEIGKINDHVWLQLTSKIFTNNVEELMYEDNLGIYYIENKKLRIKRRKVSRDYITEIQTNVATKNKDTIACIIEAISGLFEITPARLEELNYYYAAYLFKEANEFFRTLTMPTDELDVGTIFNDSGATTSESMDNVV